ncbi:hypothetical protein HK101_001609, partial [Irineochytrium annulatum]
MIELAQRAVEQGARGTQSGILNAVDTGNVDLARVVLDATDPDDLAQWRELDVWPLLEFVGDMWPLLVGIGFKVNKNAIVRFAFEFRHEDIDGDAAVSILRGMLEAAEPYKHEVLRQTCDMEWHSWRDEEDVRLLAIIELLLDFGYQPLVSDYNHAKEYYAKQLK